ncbi:MULTISPECIES: GAF domain-containing hybrid sensor histidine kinase/response regulator [unclassified Coprococcus]|uniref:GAF domain-containing hybrid sensor histidine kinase/response regulator n=1 Tax=unclassified Coprococcus TaxID=2684943 RepID=UPI0022E00C61|nr:MULTISPECIES: GAF domain-containing hybrid sensor histidine kinase/response regulator [unclassified Coprococcus]
MNNDKDNATLYAELEAERFMTDQISLLHEAEDLADGINFMLKSLGEFTDADRAYVFETSENHTSTNTYEWCAAGVTPQIRNLHDIPFESMPKWIEVFLHGENILIEDLEAYRESMPLEYELLKVQNVSTLIAFPISVHEKLIGFVGVDNPDMEKSNLLHRLLSLLGKYVGTMIKDHKNEQMRLEVVASKSRLDYQLEMDEILRGAQIGIWTLEMDGVKAPRLHPNPTMCTLLGVSQEMSPEEVYQFWYHRLPPKYVTPVLDYIQKVIHESYSEITYPWNHPLLGQIWIRCGGILYPDYQGNGICIRGYHQDVTRNIENERKYQNLTAATSQIYHAIYHIDLIQDRIEKLAGANQNYTPTGVVTSATAQLNDILEKLVAPSHHEIMQYFFDLTTVNDRLHGKLFISREYPSPQGIWRRATFIVQNRDTDDDVTEILYVTQIIDDYKQKELAYQQELVKAVESANQANTAKTDFLNRMSHDIRTPLNGILGMLDIAQKNETNPKALLECHEKMRTAAFHLKALVNDVLDMQRMETDRFFLEQIPFDIREILDNCWSMLEAQASRLDITLKKIKPGSLKYPYLIGSPLHIRQIFMNLLSNAIKYNKPGGSISVHAKIIRQVHQNVIYKFIISDTGIGISPEFQKHIFEPFAQEDTGARTIYKGTGLGMAIVHRLVQEMGGTIQLKSEKNVGSTFTLILPFTIDEHQPSASAETATDTPADLTDLHILVVEDNELNLEIAVFSLEAAGLNVSTAINGLEAVRLFEKSKPYEYDIILMDIMMPVMNGLDAAKAIRGLSRPDATTVPIIALSANAFAEDIQKSKNAGINEHLAKPLEMDKVLKVIASYCK